MTMCDLCNNEEGVYECTCEECGKRFCTACIEWYYDVAECPVCHCVAIYNPESDDQD